MEDVTMAQIETDVIEVVKEFPSIYLVQKN